MDGIRDLFSKLKKGRKGDKRKLNGMRGGSEGASSVGSLPRPESHVTVGDGGDRVHGAGIERRDASQVNLHQGVKVGAQNRPSREEGGVDETNRLNNPSAPSTSHNGKPDST